MSTDNLTTLERLESILDGEWTESAPLDGPPTQWSARIDLDAANLHVSIDFSPMNDETSAGFEVNGSDFSFSGTTKVGGFDPAGALRRLLDRFESFGIDPIASRADVVEGTEENGAD